MSYFKRGVFEYYRIPEIGSLDGALALKLCILEN